MTRPEPNLINQLPHKEGVKRLTVLQGEAHASGDPRVEMSTILGSCVCTCLYDPVARVGGMNHFLLAEPPSARDHQPFDKDYGLFLMELLINEMLKLGGIKSRMRARLYGGANINPDLAPIGSANAAFARGFLTREGIALGAQDLEGSVARRVQFRPVTGQVRCRKVENDAAPKENTSVRPQSHNGNVELF